MDMMAKPKVLIVDDNELNVKLFSAILQRKYQIFKALSAEEGIETAKRVLPDLILMDIQLPGMDGLTATQEIKKDFDLCAIPVIAVTSFAMVGDREKALSAGCDDYMPKPIDRLKLEFLVARILNIPEPHQADFKTENENAEMEFDLRNP